MSINYTDFFDKAFTGPAKDYMLKNLTERQRTYLIYKIDEYYRDNMSPFGLEATDLITRDVVIDFASKHSGALIHEKIRGIPSPSYHMPFKYDPDVELLKITPPKKKMPPKKRPLLTKEQFELRKNRLKRELGKTNDV